jgi:hypothetical protein
VAVLPYIRGTADSCATGLAEEVAAMVFRVEMLNKPETKTKGLHGFLEEKSFKL